MIDTTKIDRNRFYSIHAIAKGKLIPWLSSYAAIKRLVDRDVKGDNILNVITVDFNNTVRYRISGERLINYLNSINK